LLRAFGVLLYAISLSLNKEMAKENQPRGLPLEPHSAQIDVTLPLHSYLRGSLQIQILRWRFDGKTPTQKYHAKYNRKNFYRLLRTLC
jgi:hypothetical protein